MINLFQNVSVRIEAAFLKDSPSPILSIETLLHGLSCLYSTAAFFKQEGFKRGVLYQRKLSPVVISIGNLTVGGTGKTPMTIYLANLLTEMGYRVTILSRGYRGKAEKTGGIVSNGKNLLLSPADAGDEPYLMASELRHIPIIVGRNRFRMGNEAVNLFSPDILLLDDGFQHQQLARDINLLLVDHERPFGNRHLLPRGPLREPISSIKRADIIVETRCNPSRTHGEELKTTIRDYVLSIPVFQSCHLPFISHRFNPTCQAGQNQDDFKPSADISMLKGKNAFAFSGLAGNRNFQRTMTEIGINITGFSEFSDHYWYNEADLITIQRKALQKKAGFIVTSQKDAARIPSSVQWPLPLVVIGVKPDFGAQTSCFISLLKNKILMAQSAK